MRQYTVDAFTDRVFTGDPAFQASERGGTLYCSLTDSGRINISGKAVLFSVSELNI